MFFVSSEDFDLNIYKRAPVPGSNIIHVYYLMKFDHWVPLQKLAFLAELKQLSYPANIIKHRHSNYPY